MAVVMECPFFGSDKGMKISCEGGSVKFASKGERRRFISQYCACAGGWGRCTLAKALQDSYELGER